MKLGEQKKILIEDYLTSKESLPVYRVEATPNFSPIDVNVQYIMEEGWSNADRIRFHFKTEPIETKNQALDKILKSVEPHLLIRHYDKAEGSFLVIQIAIDGTIEILSNDKDFAHKYMQGLFLEFPPSFHSIEDLEVSGKWINDPKICAFFLGLLSGALGWDSFNQIPSAIKTSLDEAEKALEIANYRSCVVMCRRTAEALIKFAYQRLLSQAPVDNQGRALSFDAVIKQFRQENPSPIPIHLLHVLDSIRVIGNIPGAHPVEIKDYKFSKMDAEFTLASLQYFIDQYFSQIDKDISKYYTLSIDLKKES